MMMDTAVKMTLVKEKKNNVKKNEMHKGACVKDLRQRMKNT